MAPLARSCRKQYSYETPSSSPSSKAVSFGRDVLVEFQCLITKQNRRDIWWAADENLEIKKEYEAVLYLLENSSPINEDHHSARGLEKRTEDRAWELYEMQRDARNAVLDAQDKHRRHKDSSRHIMEAYQMHTIQCSYVAHKVALEDAMQVQEYLKEIVVPNSFVTWERTLHHTSPLKSPASKSVVKWGRRISMPLMCTTDEQSLKQSVEALPIEKEQKVRAANLALATKRTLAASDTVAQDRHREFLSLPDLERNEVDVEATDIFSKEEAKKKKKKEKKSKKEKKEKKDKKKEKKNKADTRSATDYSSTPVALNDPASEVEERIPVELVVRVLSRETEDGESTDKEMSEAAIAFDQLSRKLEKKRKKEKKEKKKKKKERKMTEAVNSDTSATIFLATDPSDKEKKRLLGDQVVEEIYKKQKDIRSEDKKDSHASSVTKLARKFDQLPMDLYPKWKDPRNSSWKFDADLVKVPHLYSVTPKARPTSGDEAETKSTNNTKGAGPLEEGSFRMNTVTELARKFDLATKENSLGRSWRKGVDLENFDSDDTMLIAPNATIPPIAQPKSEIADQPAVETESLDEKHEVCTKIVSITTGSLDQHLTTETLDVNLDERTDTKKSTAGDACKAPQLFPADLMSQKGQLTSGTELNTLHRIEEDDCSDAEHQTGVKTKPQSTNNIDQTPMNVSLSACSEDDEDNDEVSSACDAVLGSRIVHVSVVTTSQSEPIISEKSPFFESSDDTKIACCPYEGDASTRMMSGSTASLTQEQTSALDDLCEIEENKPLSSKTENVCETVHNIPSVNPCPESGHERSVELFEVGPLNEKKEGACPCEDQETVACMKLEPTLTESVGEEVLANASSNASLNLEKGIDTSESSVENICTPTHLSPEYHKAEEVSLNLGEQVVMSALDATNGADHPFSKDACMQTVCAHNTDFDQNEVDDSKEFGLQMVPMLAENLDQDPMKVSLSAACLDTIEDKNNAPSKCGDVVAIVPHIIAMPVCPISQSEESRLEEPATSTGSVGEASAVLVLDVQKDLDELLPCAFTGTSADDTTTRNSLSQPTCLVKVSGTEELSAAMAVVDVEEHHTVVGGVPAALKTVKEPNEDEHPSVEKLETLDSFPDIEREITEILEAKKKSDLDGVCSVLRTGTELSAIEHTADSSDSTTIVTTITVQTQPPPASNDRTTTILASTAMETIEAKQQQPKRTKDEYDVDTRMRGACWSSNSNNDDNHHATRSSSVPLDTYRCLRIQIGPFKYKKGRVKFLV